jgi:fructosamine-3-kinase
MGRGAAGLAETVGAALGVAVTSARPLEGGDINDAFALALADGRTVFAKTNAEAPPGLFATEASGLAWLGQARALRVPQVLAVSGDDAGRGPGFLVLELIAEGTRRRDFDEVLGRGLAALHRFGAPSFGWDRDNFIGRLPQANAPSPTWPAFYRTRRLEPQLQRAVDRGLIPGEVRAGFDRLFAVMDDRCGPPEPPARLHGDLWSGNHLIDETGSPCLIDPAVYGGHREVDLAMMRLFGGYGARVFAAYAELFPLAQGHEERISLYQLYPLLVHVNLFGAGYVPSVAAALDRLL